jgi:predicted N-formylglutamate amidohydrolase
MLKTVFTCEHGGNQIPEKYTSLFDNFRSTLITYKAYDIGAMSLYKDLLEETGDFGNHFQFSRMLVDVDKDLKSPDLFSQPIAKLSTKERNKVLDEYYHSWRNQVEEEIAKLCRNNHVLHCSVHTFPHIVNNIPREVDVALLIDESRKHEAAFAAKFIEFLLQENPKLRLQTNYPIPGGQQGFVHHLKEQKFKKKYIGIQLEVSQAFPLGKSEKWIELRKSIVKCFKLSLKEFKASFI